MRIKVNFINFYISFVQLEFKDKYYNFEAVSILIEVISLMKNSFFFMELYEDFT